MKTTDCPDVFELGKVLELPLHHPQRRHVSGCPRCRSLVLAYEAFREGDADPEAGRAADRAEALLDVHRSGLLGGSDTSQAVAVNNRTQVTGGKRPASPWWRKSVVYPRLALASAAVVVAATLFSLGSPGPKRGAEPAVRGTTASSLALSSPEYLPGGGVRLAWRSVVGGRVDEYEIALFSTQLDPIARIPVGKDTSITLEAKALPRGYLAGEPLLFWVEAHLGGDAIAHSATGSMQLPSR